MYIQEGIEIPSTKFFGIIALPYLNLSETGKFYDWTNTEVTPNQPSQYTTPPLHRDF